MSYVIFRMWAGGERDAECPFDYGTLLVFDRLRIKTASVAESVTAWSWIEGLVKRLATRASFMVLKAYPLEFENNAPKDLRAKENLDHRLQARQAAMRRLYRHRVGMQDFPSEATCDKWMWRVFNAEVGLPNLSAREDPVERTREC
jgi:hypothetical protein